MDLVQLQLELAARCVAGRARLHAGDRASPAGRRHPGAREPRDDAARRDDVAGRRGPHRVRAAGRPRRAHRHVRLHRVRHEPELRLAVGEGRDVHDEAGPGRRRSPRRQALGEFRIEGAATNIAFLRAVLMHPDFLARPPTSASSTTTFASCSTPRASSPDRSRPDVADAGGRAGVRLDSTDPLAVLDLGKSEPQPRRVGGRRRRRRSAGRHGGGARADAGHDRQPPGRAG